MRWNTVCPHFGYGNRYGPSDDADDRTVYHSGSVVLPQMRPEKITPKDTPAKFMELGISEDWVPVIQKAGYNLVSDMKEVNPQKLHMDICGINKKYKLELTNPTVDEVAGWIAKIEN